MSSSIDSVINKGEVQDDKGSRYWISKVENQVFVDAIEDELVYLVEINKEKQNESQYLSESSYEEEEKQYNLKKKSSIKS